MADAGGELVVQIADGVLKEHHLFNVLTGHDTGLCLPGFSGLVGSVSSGEPAPNSAGCLGAESADGCVVI